MFPIKGKFWEDAYYAEYKHMLAVVIIKNHNLGKNQDVVDGKAKRSAWVYHEMVA